MKKRYFYSMLVLFPIIILFDSIYLIYHQSLSIFLGLGAVQFVLYGLLNYAGCCFIYRPINNLFISGKDSIEAKTRIDNLSSYSSGLIFFIGNLYVGVSFLPLYFFPSIFKNPEDFIIDQIPPEFFFLSILPAIYFIYALFPAFIAYFIINDFKIDLKEEVFSRFKINYPVGKHKIGQTLLYVLFFLVILPSLLTILEIKMAFEMEDKYKQFTSLSPLETVLIDRFVVFIGTIIAAILITRAFTKPIHSLLRAMGSVSEGNFSTQAAITTDDEIGFLAKEFNHMVNGLKEREVIRDTFGKYVTKDVATFILDRKINLEGEMRHCTILVTDIADYTTISEELSPKEIVIMLNEYFSVLVGIIQSHKGVVNKFIGDSIFAMFNVPLDDSEHAINAILAAIQIETITSNQTFGKNRNLNTRIGINTGVVVAGNIGSSDRIEYTVIGDDVNVAARLEQLNKQFGTNILLGENTYNLAKNNFSFTEMGDFQLKGKEKSIKVFKVNRD